MRWKNRNALLSLTLSLLATGCASTQTITKTETVYRYPPEILTQPCPAPEYTGSTWGDLAHYTVRLKGAVDLCNEDKRLIREWVAEHE